MFIKTRTSIRLYAVALLGLFLTFYIVNVRYTHMHIVNGVSIVHSHPFSGHHGHNSNQTLVLQLISCIQTLEMEHPDFIKPEITLVRIIESEPEVSIHLLNVKEGIFLRAPPSYRQAC